MFSGKDRRTTGDFIGAERVLRELKEGPARRRIGLEIAGAPARQGAEIFSDDEATQIGKTWISGPPRESSDLPMSLKI